VSRQWHHEALRGAGLRQTIRLQDFRHSAAAGWLATGLPMIYVQRQLGHSNIGTTIDLYGHLEESFLRDAAARAEAAIWGPPPRLVPRLVPRATLATSWSPLTRAQSPYARAFVRCG
jgi:hypothetical protein